MTVLTRWYPYRELNTLQERVNRLFHESFSNEGRDESLATSSDHASFSCAHPSSSAFHAACSERMSASRASLFA